VHNEYKTRVGDRIAVQSGAATEVVAVAGRRIDPPDAAFERFPLHHRDRVRQAIASVLAARPVSAVVSSAACGADLLALEAARDLGIRRRVILPFAVDRFRATSVIDRPGNWGPLFDVLVADAAERGDLLVLAADDGEEAFARANLAILAEGDALAVAANAVKRALIVWDGASRGREDLTDQFRAAAIARGWVVDDVPTQ